MNTQPALSSVSLIVHDMPTSLAFYRLLGLAIPAERTTDRTSACSFPADFRWSSTPTP